LFILAGRAERVIPLQAKAASRVEEPAAFVRVSTARQGADLHPLTPGDS